MDIIHMRSALLTTVLLLAASLTAGCSDGLGNTSSTTSIVLPPPPAFAYKHVIYAAQLGLNSIGVYALDETNGDIAMVENVSAGYGSAPRSVVVDPSGKFLYAASTGLDNITGYAINQSLGTLSLIANKPTYNKPTKVTINAAGTYLFAAHEETNSITAYTINPTSGILTEASTFGFGVSNSPKTFAVHPTGNFATASTESFTQSYTVTSGALTTAGSSLAAQYNDAQFSPNGSFYAAADSSDHRIVTYAVNTGNPTPMTVADNLLLSGTATVHALAYDSATKFLFSANTADHKVQSFTVNAGTGALTSSSSLTVASNCLPRSLTVDPGGGYLTAACSSSLGTLATFAIDATTGALTRASTVTLSNAKIFGLATVVLP